MCVEKMYIKSFNIQPEKVAETQKLPKCQQKGFETQF